MEEMNYNVHKPGPVSSGGGVKGPVYTGAPRPSEERGSKLDTTAGMSAGLPTGVPPVDGHMLDETKESPIGCEPLEPV